MTTSPILFIFIVTFAGLIISFVISYVLDCVTSKFVTKVLSTIGIMVYIPSIMGVILIIFMLAVKLIKALWYM